jgi:hypothetical protein
VAWAICSLTRLSWMRSVTGVMGDPPLRKRREGAVRPGRYPLSRFVVSVTVRKIRGFSYQSSWY